MPEAKNNFFKGKMNKDLDKRLIQDGEYLDARNVSISNSTSSSTGRLENVIGNIELSDFGLTDRNLEVIGVYEDVENGRLFFFITNYTDSTPNANDRFAVTNSSHYITCYDTTLSQYYILVKGNFLNFSKTHRINHINLIEDLLFWTDNRNQPRKINVKTAIAQSGSINDNPYYSMEEHISVAKYYPWNGIRLYKRSYELDDGDANKGRINDYNHSLFSKITELYDTATLSNANSPYTFNVISDMPSDGEMSTSGDGSGLTVLMYVDASDNVSDLIVTDGGVGFAVGDTISFVDPESATGDTLTITLEEQDFWIEPTMKDTTSTLLPYSAEATSAAWGGGGSASSGTFTRSDTNQDLSAFVGCLIYVEDNADAVTVPISQGVYITAINTDGSGVVLSEAISIASTDTIYIGANPYYNENDISTISNIRDKFVRFSYRFKFDDNEYSLIAPFTQPTFIPKQDGYFTGDWIDIDKDEQETVKSSNVSFFENKVTEVGLIIDLPEGVSSVSELATDLKVKEVDILYKDANEPSVKIVKTIKEDELLINSDTLLEYTYKSTKPIKVIPENEIVRVYDRVPVLAKTQESIGNRVVYANYLESYAGLDVLDYVVTSGEKDLQGGINDAYSRREYPSHTLKQNRTYQVGVVLVDKFGRKSSPIVSDNSTVFHQYKDSSFNLIDSDDVYFGDALRVSFNQDILGVASNPLYKGLYSADTNPMGWYSYQIVVKQKEQSYYNAYVPTLLNDYPKTSGSFANDIAHITLVGDNVNKIPRDFELSNDGDGVFRSSIQLYPRINNSVETSSHDGYLITSNLNSPNKVSVIGQKDDMGLDKTQSNAEYFYSPFYSIPDNNSGSTGAIGVGSNPLIARLSTRSQLGAQGGNNTANYVQHDEYSLNVLETRPIESNLELYWETSTSGLISELNANVLTPENATGIPYQLADFTFELDETSQDTDVVATDFYPQDFFDGDIINANTTCTIVSVKDQNGNSYPNKFSVTKTGGNKFNLIYNENPREYYNQFSNINNNYDIVFNFTNVVDGVTVSRNVLSEGNRLLNIAPTFAEDATNLGDVPSLITVNQSTGVSDQNWREVGSVTIGNGSVFTGSGGLNLNDLSYTISKVEWYNTGNSTWYDYWYFLNKPGGRSSTSFIGERNITREPHNLIRIVFDENHHEWSAKLLYSPLIQWGWHDRPPYTVVSNAGGYGFPYFGETGYFVANVAKPSSYIPNGSPSFNSPPIFKYFATDIFLYNTPNYNNDIGLISDFNLYSGVIPTNGIRDYISSTSSGFNSTIEFASFRNVSSETVLLTDMQMRVTFTLYDANRNGTSKEFTVYFDVERDATYGTYNDS